jgi:hypothetical protein
MPRGLGGLAEGLADENRSDITILYDAPHLTEDDDG